MLPRALALLCAALGLFAVGCDQQANQAKAGQGAKQSSQSRQAAKPQRPRQLHWVEAHLVEREPLTLARELTGTLRTRRVLRVFTQEEGRLVDMPYLEGDVVAAGAVLMRLERALLDAQVERADAVRRDADSHLAQLERLNRSRAVAAEEVRRARTAVQVAAAEHNLLRTRLAFTEERAPFAGVVSERPVELGDFVSKGTHVLTLSDPLSLVVEVDVGELLLPYVSLGMPVALRIDALGGGADADGSDGALHGEVVRIHPNLDPRTRQGRVEIAARSWPVAARAGQLARVALEVSAGERVMVPPPAVRRDMNGEFVYQLSSPDADTPGRASVSRTAVRVGRRLASKVEIVDGIEPGARIVLRGFVGLRDGKAVALRAPVDTGQDARPSSLRVDG